MHAVIRTGGKQYRVKAGDELKIEKLEAEKGGEVVFDQVLAVGEGESLKIGTPLVGNASVKASVIANERGKKIIIFKKKRRKGYQVKRGHRQHYTRVRILEINA
ncbi:50S ribosomal protein L21 [Microvenator marinus]|jgi:large subunit ribosomal protein L21|uniref:Large ribosomal subunit protein bL21 n=1 Tax=Microvenator marinus TaxID=2600177 RepID=A0A5B8XVD1_9DELT|nr:50S ribosomal protein L21 [Microvenator marinus]QED29545.1 50S ribosomal protein L21 [Microvenator marinus]